MLILFVYLVYCLNGKHCLLAIRFVVGSILYFCINSSLILICLLKRSGLLP